MRTDISKRLSRAEGALAAAGLDALLLGPSADLRYLTGFSPMPLERLVLALIRPDGPPRLIVPELEASGARDAGAGDVMELVGWSDGADPYAATAELLPPAPKVAVGDTLWASHLLALQRALPGGTMTPASEVLAGVRSVKDEEELDALQRAGSAADRAFERITAETFSGRTERQIASLLAEFLVQEGHDRADFTIVGSGPHSASPHHEPTTREIQPEDVVVLDFGGEIDGYFSDTTRTVVVRGAPAEAEEVHAAVAAAQGAAFGAVAPGVEAQDVDRAARAVIEAAGFGEGFFHRTGHGIGLELHEAPYIVDGNETPLETGMTFSIEPGIYLSGRFGVRIEDIVVVTQDGARRLNDSDRALRVVG